MCSGSIAVKHANDELLDGFQLIALTSRYQQRKTCQGFVTDDRTAILSQ